MFVEFGWDQDTDQILPLLRHSEKARAMNFLNLLSNLKTGISNIATASEKAAKIVFALKTFAHFDQGGEKTRMKVRDGLETVLTLYQNQLKQNIQLEEHYDEVPEILGYPDELNQVWTNLIHNALQAMKNQGALSIRVQEIDKNIRVSITDTGPGIPDEIREKIFDPFFTTKSAGEGSGLGLDISRKIVQKHNGTISVDSTTGEGSTFTIDLPIS